MFSGIGRLGNDVEILTLEKDNKPFTVSNNVIFFKEHLGAEDVPIDVVFYNGANTLLQKRSIKKGDFLFVEGHFKLDKWQNANDEPRSKLKLIVSRFFDPKSSSNSNDDDFYFDEYPVNFLEKK